MGRISLNLFNNAFQTKLQRIIHVVHPGFETGYARLKYFHYVTLHNSQ